MTTGNVSTTGNVKASFMNFAPVQNTQGARKTDDFKNFLPQDGNQSKTDSKAKPGRMDNSLDEPVRTVIGKTERILKKESTSTVNTDDGRQVIEDAMTQIKDSIKEVLSVSDEDLEKMMAELGFGIQDLLIPQNLAALTAYANGAEPASIVFDETMLSQFNELVSEIDKTINLTADELGITDDQVKDILAQLGEMNLTQEPAAKDNVIQETEDVKSQSADVTNADANVTETVVKFDKTDNNHQSNDSSKGDDQKGTHSGNLENLMQNITNAVNESLSTVSDEFSVKYGVNAAEMVEQVIDAVKVTMNEDVTSMEMWLNPQSLGKVSISVTAKDGVMMATITAQNESAKAALESQLVQLKQTLNDQGLKVTEVEVNVATEGFNSNADSERQNMAGQDRRQGNRRFRNLDVSGTIDDGSETFGDMEELRDGTSLNLKA